ncbi:hypothetical protein NL54_22365 [Pantoea stewartii]|nr:hypothetical protein NL54_22365 [Pantoea stewartii]
MVPLSALPPIRFWLEPIHRLNYRICVGNLYVAGMMGVTLITEEQCFLHRMMRFAHITTVLLTNMVLQHPILLPIQIKIVSLLMSQTNRAIVVTLIFLWKTRVVQRHDHATLHLIIF